MKKSTKVVLTSVLSASVLFGGADFLPINVAKAQTVEKTKSTTVKTAAPKEQITLDGWVMKNNDWFYYTNDAMVKDWVFVNGYWYYMKNNGTMASAEWLKWNKNWYYLNPNGVMATGWVQWNNNWYYLHPNGVMATGWLKWNNHWYFLESNGVMTTGWFKWNKNWYFLHPNGVMATDWIQWNSNKYYLDSDGIMKISGTLASGGVTYTFSGDGIARPKVEKKVEQKVEQKADLSGLIKYAEQFRGIRYRSGGSTTAGFDCSGFVTYVYRNYAGISLPRTCSGLYTSGTAVSRANLEPGDLVLFNTRGGPSHVAIYAGNNRIIHCYNSGGVGYSNLSESYWNARYLGARRIK